MRESPRRPLILKRRKLPFQRNEADLARDEPDGPRLKEAPKPQSAQCFPDGIRIMDHPTMPDTQVVVIPKSADLQSVIDALTAKGKECGPQGPNKFILLSGSSSSEDGTASMCQGLLGATGNSARSSLALPAIPEGCAADCGMDIKPLTSIKPLNRELDCCPLDDSLTNIQWLGRMSTDGLAPEPAGKASDKENQVAGPPGPLPVSEAEEEKFAVKDPLSERPPYSYMAMIQFAINSKKSRRMTLKEIYLWIEDHFPYFRDVAKPGWKNSIRHNLSLHDMFVRETTPDGKISYWTIRPEANRCLTLDQVYKTGADPDAAPPAQTAQVCAQQQQKRGVPDLKRPAGGSSERKMKPLLPRTDSYLVPIQLPLPTSLYLPPSASQLSLPNPPAGHGGGKRVRIAPKVTQSDVTSGQLCPPAFENHLKEEPPCVPLSSEPPAAPPPKRSSRRKQRLVLPSREEPVLLFSDSTFFDSGLASDTSAFQDTREAELHPCPDPDSPFRSAFVFKTPVKSGTLPASSTPSGLPAEPWRVTPLGKGSGGGGGALDYSPIRTPGRLALTPQRLGNTPLSFSSTPFKELPLFGSPRELLASCGPSPSAGCTPSSRNGAPNRSLTEGLVLDTMNDSLSKILVDISFSGLEDEELAMSNISWSQLIPDLK